MATWTAYPPDEHTASVWAYFAPPDFDNAVFITSRRRRGIGITDSLKRPRMYFPPQMSIEEAQVLLDSVRAEYRLWASSEFQRIADAVERNLTTEDLKCITLTYRDLDLQIRPPLLDEINRKRDAREQKELRERLQSALTNWRKSGETGIDDLGETEIQLG